MRPAAAWAWALAIVVTALVFSLVIPRLADMGPQTTTLETDTEFLLAGSFVTLPAGWELDIASTVSRVPAASDAGLSVRAEDALWWGSSQDLVARVAELTGASDIELPEIPADAVGKTREVWRLDVPATDDRDAGRIDVVRFAELVVLVISSGDAAALERPEVDAIVDSVDLEPIPLEVRTGSALSAALLDEATVRGVKP